MYYISVRQILESEKVIRLKNLVKFDKLSLAEIKEIFEADNEERAMKIEISVQLLLDSLPSTSIVIPDFVADGGLQGDESILFFIGGYCSRSRSKKTNCNDCKEMLVKDWMLEASFAEEEATMEEEKLKESFLNAINRGGLVKPSDLVYISCVCIYTVYKEVMDQEESKRLLMDSEDARSVFAKTVVAKMKESPDTEETLLQKCSQGHPYEPVFSVIAQQVFNMMAKNLVSEINDAIHESRKRDTSAKGNSNSRKIQKLSSDK